MRMVQFWFPKTSLLDLFEATHTHDVNLQNKWENNFLFDSYRADVVPLIIQYSFHGKGRKLEEKQTSQKI